VVEIGGELAVAIMNEEAMPVLPGDDLPQLTKRPLRGGMLGDVGVEHLVGAELDDETIGDAERRTGTGCPSLPNDRSKRGYCPPFALSCRRIRSEKRQ
jgi:hypothetical protein